MTGGAVVNGQVVGSSPDSATVADAPAKVKSPFKSKTFWVATAWAAIRVASDWKNPQAWQDGLAAVAAAYSVRQAISKNGYGL